MVGCMTRRIRALLLVGGLAIAGCGSSSSNGSGATTTEAGGHPAGAQAVGVVEDDLPERSPDRHRLEHRPQSDGQHADLGRRRVLVQVRVPERHDHAVGEGAPQRPQTTAAYKAFGTKLGKRPEVVSFGEGAFITTNGSVIVRKDFKVLDVDVSKLPQQFGDPPQDRSNIALSIAATVMSCWTGE